MNSDLYVQCITPRHILLTVSRDLYVQCITSLQILLTVSRDLYVQCITSLQILLTVFRDLYVLCITSLQILLTVSRIPVRMEPHVQMKVSPIVVHVLEIGLEISVAIVSCIQFPLIY